MGKRLQIAINSFFFVSFASIKAPRRRQCHGEATNLKDKSMSRDNDISYFVSFCIEQYKKAKGMDGAETASLFFSSGVASYLADNFDVLHTQSRQWLIEEIEEKIEGREAR